MTFEALSYNFKSRNHEPSSDYFPRQSRVEVVGMFGGDRVPVDGGGAVGVVGVTRGSGGIVGVGSICFISNVSTNR